MAEIKTITSFTIDHDLLEPGFYISRVDGSVTTYDLRTRKPNAGFYMDNLTMHSVEHMLATFLRNSEISDHVVYFGPMGCQTGFYLLMRDLEPKTVFESVKSAIRRTLDYEGEVFGAERKACGNYRNLSLAAAKMELRTYLDVLEGITDDSFSYRE